VPFAYAEVLAGPVQADARHGTLFFPGHSTHRVTSSADFEGMAEALTRLGSRFQPVSVCIYWRDQQLGRHRPFVDRGLPVVSAGHMYDPDFLFRLLDLLRRHRYAASNEAGSTLVYSVIAGCRFFLLSDFAATRSGLPQDLQRDVSKRDPLVDEIWAIFGEPSDEVTKGQKALVRALAGLDHVLTPEQLRNCFLAAERLDRFGLAYAEELGGLAWTLPPGPVRALRRAGRRVLSVLSGASS
jgi:hypothetical protein